MIIASGTSNRQTRALASSVRETVKKRGLVVLRTEGEDNGEWIIVDCGAAVAHIMQPAVRDYYHLEEIWGAKPVRLKGPQGNAAAEQLAARFAKGTSATVATKVVTKPATKTAGKTAFKAPAKTAAKTGAKTGARTDARAGARTGRGMGAKTPSKARPKSAAKSAGKVFAQPASKRPAAKTSAPRRPAAKAAAPRKAGSRTR